MPDLTVERSIWIDAARERVWRAVTQPELVAQWLLPPALDATLKRDDAGTLFVCMYGQEIPVAVQEAVDPVRQVTIRSVPDRVLATTFTLHDEQQGTRVIIRMTGFDALPAADRQDRMAPSATAWDHTLHNLKAQVDGVELPFPQGYVAALFGYRRETNETFAVERSIWIAAPCERVWQAITDPAQIEGWFSPGTAWRMTALEVGGRLFVPEADTGAELHAQVITVVDPPRRLVLRSERDAAGSFEDTIYTLRDERGGTRLTITNTGYEWVPTDGRWAAMEQNAIGFGMMLENLQAVSEGRPVPYPGGF